MSEEIHVHHHYEDKRPRPKKLGFVGFLGLALVIGGILAQPVILGPLTALVIIVALLVHNQRKGKAGGPPTNTTRNTWGSGQ